MPKDLTISLNDFMVRRSSRYVSILPSLVAIGPVVVQILVLVRHTNSQDQVSNGSCDFTGRSPSSKLPFCQV